MKLPLFFCLTLALSLRGEIPTEEVASEPAVVVPKPANLEKKPRFTVRVTSDKEYFIEGASFSLEQIEALLKHTQKLVPDLVLLAEGDLTVEFRHCRALIKAASKGGVDEVIFVRAPLVIEEEKTKTAPGP